MAAAIPIIGLGAQLVGTAVDIAGKVNQANAQARVGEMRRRAANEDADRILARSRDEEQRFRLSGRKAIGLARANIGASGITLEGSAQDALEESAANIEIDALNIRNQGILQASATRRQGEIFAQEGRAGQGAVPFSAASSLLGLTSSLTGGFKSA